MLYRLFAKNLLAIHTFQRLEKGCVRHPSLYIDKQVLYLLSTRKERWGLL